MAKSFGDIRKKLATNQEAGRVGGKKKSSDKNKTTEKYSLNIDKVQLSKIRELSELTGMSIKDIFKQSIHEYMENNWNEEQIADYRKWKESKPTFKKGYSQTR